MLDWNGKRFVRVPALEKKVETRSRAAGNDCPGEADVRTALGIAKK